jgi:hypothetical protein
MAMEKGFIPPVSNILKVKEDLKLEERKIKASVEESIKKTMIM